MRIEDRESRSSILYLRSSLISACSASLRWVCSSIWKHHSYFQSGSSGCFKSHSGRRLRTSGKASKLYSGGGELVDHSSVHASHGSLPASAPWFSALRRLITKQLTPAA